VLEPWLMSSRLMGRGWGPAVSPCSGRPADVTEQRVAFEFRKPDRIAGIAFGVTPSTCEVRVGEAGAALHKGDAARTPHR
jgi:hypothetical protein